MLHCGFGKVSAENVPEQKWKKTVMMPLSADGCPEDSLHVWAVKGGKTSAVHFVPVSPPSPVEEHLQSPDRPCECVFVYGISVRGAVVVLRQRVDGIDGWGGLGALIALCLILVLLHRVLANEWAILVELAVAALAVVHQAVITLFHVTVERRLAALQRFVVLVTTVEARWEKLAVKRGARRC